jgi:hypothetical protein
MRVMQILADATNVIAEGEVLQLMNMHDASLDEAGYLRVIRSKTAKLFEASAGWVPILSGPAGRRRRGLRQLWAGAGHRIPGHRRCAGLRRRCAAKWARIWATTCAKARPPALDHGHAAWAPGASAICPRSH